MPFSKNQLHSLFKLNLSARDRLLLTILITTGMRLHEAALLDWNNVKKHEAGFIFFDTRFGIVKNTGSEDSYHYQTLSICQKGVGGVYLTIA